MRMLSSSAAMSKGHARAALCRCCPQCAAQSRASSASPTLYRHAPPLQQRAAPLARCGRDAACEPSHARAPASRPACTRRGSAASRPGPGVGARSSLQSLCEPPGVSSTLLGASSGRFLGLPPGIERRNNPKRHEKALASQPSFESVICEMHCGVLFKLPVVTPARPPFDRKARPGAVIRSKQYSCISTRRC